MTYQLINRVTRKRVTAAINGFPARRDKGDPQTWTAPDGYAYVPVLPPPEEYDRATETIERDVTLDADGWRVRALTPEELAARNPVPFSIRPEQLREWLYINRRLADVTAAIAAVSNAATRERLALWWEYATEIHRDNPRIKSLANALNMTDADIDTMFREAAEL